MVPNRRPQAGRQQKIGTSEVEGASSSEQCAEAWKLIARTASPAEPQLDMVEQLKGEANYVELPNDVRRYSLTHSWGHKADCSGVMPCGHTEAAVPCWKYTEQAAQSVQHHAAILLSKLPKGSCCSGPMWQNL